jgi:3-dehydroquinate synthase
MTNLKVKTTGRQIYKINFADNFDTICDELYNLYTPNRKICIITDSNIEKLFLSEFAEELKKVYKNTFIYVVPAGEDYKNLNTVSNIYTYLIKNRFDRNDFLISLGGGVMGDMAGFVAATYLRGIDYVQVPTTLLSQVDSSIGGKVGIDLIGYKNLAGAFYNPRLVYMNFETLGVLPDEYYFSGLSEAIKSALIKSRGYYDWINSNKDGIYNRDIETMKELVYRSCEIKKAVVESDFLEKGERAILNFGHTIGHAIEEYNSFRISHGDCVALGMVSAMYISLRRGLITEADFEGAVKTLRDFRLPVSTTAIDPEKLIELVKNDKKMDAGKIHFILLKNIGEAVIVKELTDSEIIEGINYLSRKEDSDD